MAIASMFGSLSHVAFNLFSTPHTREARERNARLRLVIAAAR